MSKMKDLIIDLALINSCVEKFHKDGWYDCDCDQDGFFDVTPYDEAFEVILGQHGCDSGSTKEYEDFVEILNCLIKNDGTNDDYINYFLKEYKRRYLK